METFRKKVLKIGSREGFINVIAAFIIDAIILICNEGADVFSKTSSAVSALVFVIAMLAFGQIFGRISAVAIIEKKFPFALIGMLCTIMVLGLSAICSGTATFLATDFSENPRRFAKDLFSYSFGIAAIFLIFSAIVIIPHGIIFGLRIKNKGDKLTS